MDKIKDAMKISESHKFGEAFDVDLQESKRQAKLVEKEEKRKQLKKEKKMAKKEAEREQIRKEIEALKQKMESKKCEAQNIAAAVDIPMVND